LIATTGTCCGVCLDFCFTLILCFLFAPSFTVVEISSYVLKSTAACASPIKNLESDTRQAYLVMIIILYIKANVVSVYLCGQKLGNAWKILPVTARSLCSWSVVDGKIG
jgi:hypothetical protein